MVGRAVIQINIIDLLEDSNARNKGKSPANHKHSTHITQHTHHFHQNTILDTRLI